MKILLINNLYKPYSRGGAENYLENLSRGFSAQGHSVSVICTKPSFDKIKKAEERVYYLNSLYFYLNKMPQVLRFLWQISNIINVVKYIQVKKILKLEKPDMVITNNLMGLGYISFCLFRKNNFKHLHILHDIQLLHPSGLIFLGQESILNKFSSRVYQRINLFITKNIQNVVAPSDWLLDLHAEKGFFKKAKKRKLFNPIEHVHHKENVKKKGNYNFLYVGQIEKHKGVDVLLEVMSEIMASDNELSLTIVGAGALDKILREKYVNKNIYFLGKLKKEVVQEKMLEADFLLVPSLCYENSPSVIYEAAVCDLEFIFSDIGGASEIGEYFCGIGFDPLDKDSLRKIIRQSKNGKGAKCDRKIKVLNLSTDNYINKVFEMLEITQKHF